MKPKSKEWLDGYEAGKKKIRQGQNSGLICIQQRLAQYKEAIEACERALDYFYKETGIRITTYYEEKDNNFRRLKKAAHITKTILKYYDTIPLLEEGLDDLERVMINVKHLFRNVPERSIFHGL